MRINKCECSSISLQVWIHLIVANLKGPALFLKASLLALTIYGQQVFFLLRMPSWDTVFWIPPVNWLGPLSVMDCVNTCVFFPPLRWEQTSDHQSSFAAGTSWQTTSSPFTLGRGASVIGLVCYAHKCPISNWTGVNPTPEGGNLPEQYFSTDSLFARTNKSVTPCLFLVYVLFPQ